MTHLIVGILLFAGAAVLQGQDATSVTRDITLGPADSAFTSVTLTNTHRRLLSDDRPQPPPAAPVPNLCNLGPKIPGVIWKIVLRGAAAQSKTIAVADQTGRQFIHVCWSSSRSASQPGAGNTEAGGGPQTEFLVAGPDSPSELTFTYGGESVVVVVDR